MAEILKRFRGSTTKTEGTPTAVHRLETVIAVLKHKHPPGSRVIWEANTTLQLHNLATKILDSSSRQRRAVKNAIAQLRASRVEENLHAVESMKSVLGQVSKGRKRLRRARKLLRE